MSTEFTGFTRGAATDILVDVLRDSYVALSTTTPDENGNNFTEPAADTGYMRKPYGELNRSETAQVANRDTIFLFLSEKAIGSITYVGLSKSPDRGDDVFLVAKLLNPLNVDGPDYVPLIKYNGFVIGLDKDPLSDYLAT